MSSRAHKKAKADRKYDYYFAVMLDLLGQSEALGNIKNVPSNDEEIEAFEQAAQSTFDSVIRFRTNIQTFVDQHNKGSSIAAGISDLSQRQRFAQLTQRNLSTMFFSDMGVVYGPLGKAAPTLPLHGFSTGLSVAATIILLGLASRIPIRGGVGIHVGGKLNGQELYGPILLNAHKLESKIAGWPRVVADERIHEFIDREAKSDDLFRQRSAQICGRMLHRDVDGATIIDYLNDFNLEILRTTKQDGMPLIQIVPERAYQFVRSEHERFSKLGNRNLALRYSIVRSYFESRRHKWASEQSSS